MQTIRQAADHFLNHKRIAVTGVSRHGGNHGSNVVYQRLRERGYDVFAVNPHAETVEGDICYHGPGPPSPEGVDAVVIATYPTGKRATQTMHECVDLGISEVWMHRGVRVRERGPTKRRPYGRTHSCMSLMVVAHRSAASDRGHQVMKAVGTLTGKVPRRVS